MASKKTIEFNPEFLTGGKSLSLSKSRKRREKKKKPTGVVKPTTLKKALLKRIKDHAAKEKKNQDSEAKELQATEDFSSDFEKHMNYLSNLSSQKAKNKTLKKREKVERPFPSINIELPEELSVNVKNESADYSKTTTFSEKLPREAPPYSNLKGGSKPTFKEWKRQTQKNLETIDIIDPPSQEKSTRAVRLEEIRKRLKENNLKQQETKEPVNSIKKRRTCKRKYKFGKDSKKMLFLF